MQFGRRMKSYKMKRDGIDMLQRKLADEFDNLGKIEGVIVDTAIGEIAVDHHIVFVGRIEGITKRLSMFNPQEAEGELTVEEIKDLLGRINNVIEGLKNVKVAYKSSIEQFMFLQIQETQLDKRKEIQEVMLWRRKI